MISRYNLAIFILPSINSGNSGVMSNLKDSRTTWNYFCFDGEALAAIIIPPMAYSAMKSQFSTDPKTYMLSNELLVPQ